VDDVTVAMSVPGADHGWQRAYQAWLVLVTVPISGGITDPGCGAGGGRACCNTSRP
jgi:hypothetical protein